MKTSNQLLIALLALVFIAIVATSMVLKAEYDKIDKDDPYYGYSLENPPSFRAVKLTGNFQELVQLQPGDAHEIRMHKSVKDEVQWKVQGDTLVVSFNFPVRQQSDFYNAFYSRSARVYVMLPHLSSLNARGVTAKLTGWKQDSLELSMQGSKRGVLLAESTIDQLSATAMQGGLILLEAGNRVAEAQVVVRDSSSFTAKYDVIDSLDLRADPRAQVALPGSLLRRAAF